jgi:endoglucanase
MDLETLKHSLHFILSKPTAPFRETQVMSALKLLCNEAQLPFVQDNFGNIWINVKNFSDLKNVNLLVVAHTDHPGIVIEKIERKKLYGKWLGGGPKDIQNSIFEVFSENVSTFAKVVSHTSGPRGPDKVILELLANFNFYKKEIKKLGACLSFESNKIKDNIIFKNNQCITKAADDLAGTVCSFLALKEALKESKNLRKTALLFTRAEESGFHGTLYVLRKKILNSKKTKILSIEASSRLSPNGLPDFGPILRLGDRMTLFNHDFTYALESIAKKIQAQDKNFKYQKRIMDGGACEASAFNLYGFKVSGISLPLINYHNQYLPHSFFDSKNLYSKNYKDKPHPEAVSINDIKNLIYFLKEIFIENEKTNLDKLNFKAQNKVKNLLLKEHKESIKNFWTKI